MENQNKNAEQVRGTELKKQMQQSEAEGRKYRAEHQGADIKPEKPLEEDEAFDEEENDEAN